MSHTQTYTQAHTRTVGDASPPSPQGKSGYSVLAPEQVDTRLSRVRGHARRGAASEAIQLAAEQRQAREDVFKEMLDQMNLNVIDDVFDAFVRTHWFQQKRFALPELLEEARVGKFFPLFDHDGHFWKATVALRREEHADVVCIRLPNNGYDSYITPPEVKEFQGGHYHGQNEGWYELTQPFFERFPKMKRAFSADYQNAWVMYHPTVRRADFHFEPRVPGKLHVRVCFEHGYAEYKKDQRTIIHISTPSKHDSY